MARQIPVQAATQNITCVVFSDHEISLGEATRITSLFLEKLKEKYGEDIFPLQSFHAYRFEIFVDAGGNITSPLPTRNEIQRSETHALEKLPKTLPPKNSPRSSH